MSLDPSRARNAAGKAGESRARPYGWLGLALSLPVILVLGLAIAAAAVALAFVVEVAVLGQAEAVARIAALGNTVRSGNPATAEFALLCLSILTYGGVALAVLFLARARGGEQWADLVGGHRWEWRRRPFVFFGTLALVIVYSFAATALLQYLDASVKNLVTTPRGARSTILFVVVATVAAPFCEELIFRGWLYTAMRARMRAWIAIGITAALFALAHWESTHLYALVVFPIGIALGLVRERADSIKASMTMHALYNGVACILLYLGQ